MRHEGEALLYVELDATNYANAFIWNFLVVTARHVASQVRNITVADRSETASVAFHVSPTRDLAISTERTFSSGYEVGPMPKQGDEVRVIGHHGPERQFFEIVARVVEILPDDRIIVERLTGKTFQLGMSGSPALNREGQVVGVLVEGVKGAGGQRVILEPAQALAE